VGQSGISRSYDKECTEIFMGKPTGRLKLEGQADGKVTKQYNKHLRQMELCHTCNRQQALVVALLQVLLQHYLCRHYSQPVY